MIILVHKLDIRMFNKEQIREYYSNLDNNFKRRNMDVENIILPITGESNIKCIYADEPVNDLEESFKEFKEYYEKELKNISPDIDNKFKETFSKMKGLIRKSKIRTLKYYMEKDDD